MTAGQIAVEWYSAGRLVWRKLLDRLVQAPSNGVTLFFLALSALFSIFSFILWRNALSDLAAVSASDGRVERLKYFYWINSYYFPSHKFTIVAFAIASATLGLAVFASAFLKSKIARYGDSFKRSFAKFSISLLALNVAYALLVLLKFRPSPVNLALLQICVMVAVAFPLIQRESIRVHVRERTLAKILFGVSGVQFIGICAFFAFGMMPIVSDYLQLPSSLYVQKQKGADKELVDSISFINDNLLWGNHHLPDPRKNPNSDPDCLPGNYLSLPQTAPLKNFVLENHYTFYLHHPQGTLCFVGRLSPQNIKDLSDLFPDHANHINEVAAQNATVWRNYYAQPLTPAAEDFSRRERVHFVNFIHDLEQVFHHHFQFLNPMKEFYLGRKISEINSPYGLAYVPMTYLASIGGKLTFNSYVFVSFAFYAAYFALWVATVHYLYRDWTSTAFVSAVYVGCFVGLGLTTLSSGLGYGPMRHGLDILAFLCLALYFRRSNPPLLLLAAALALANVFADRFLGAFCPLALACTLVLRGAMHAGRRPIFEMALGVVVAIAIAFEFVFVGAIIAPNPYAAQFFDGVWGFPISAVSVATSILFVSLGLGVSLRSIFVAPADRKWLAIYLFVLVLLFTLYWLILPNYGHLYKVISVAALAIAVLWRECISEAIASLKVKRAVAFSLLALGAFWYVNGSRFFASTTLETAYHLRASRLFQWNFDAIKVSSTIEPSMLTEATQLIETYSQDSKYVSILSEFDNLLLFLAGRVSEMPHFEVPTFLNGPDHLAKVVEDIKVRKPRYIFVDSCIQCSAVPYRLTRIVPFLHPSYLERTVEKVDRLQQLRSAFAAIENEYEPVPQAQGRIISVYRRIDKVASDRKP
ncbi:hypothetical protein [Terrarubrum flagellatum]|uniref:hypothetical protein n=1 Tax=Terrirubrum flagellatum TaxID=2895980 RepID=UPI003144F6FA